MWGTQGTPGPRAGARVPSIGKPGSGARSQNPDASQPQGPRRRERYAGVGRAHALSHTCSHVLTRSHTRASSFPLGRVTTPFSLSHPAGPPPAPRLLTERTRSHAPEVNPPTTAARSAALRASSPRVWAAASGVPGQGLGGLGLSRARSAQTTPLGAPFPPAPAGRSSAHRTGLRVRRPAPASCRHVLLLAHAPRVRDANRPRGSKAESSGKGGNGGEH